MEKKILGLKVLVHSLEGMILRMNFCLMMMSLTVKPLQVCVDLFHAVSDLKSGLVRMLVAK